MRKIGEQWEEMIDGKKHLLVIVENTSNLICGGCDFGYYQAGDHLCSFGLNCPASCGVVKDLGILNDDGCLPCPFCGEYPTIISPKDGYQRLTRPSRNGFCVVCNSCETLNNFDIDYGGSCKTKQEAIDKWNRRT